MAKSIEEKNLEKLKREIRKEELAEEKNHDRPDMYFEDDNNIAKENEEIGSIGQSFA